MSFALLGTAAGVAANVAGAGDLTAAQVPAAVTCADARQLSERAAVDRRESERQSSDQKQIVMGNRANFLASLAVIAELKCKVTLAAADEALTPAFDAARKAEASNSMYEKAQRWSEADFITTRAMSMLIRQLR